MAVVFFPTKFEAEGFVKQLTNEISYEMADSPAWIGELGKLTVHVAITGMGLPHCVHRTRKVLELVKPKRAILAGFGGGLDPALGMGDLIIDTDGSKITTAEKVVGTPAEKAALFKATGKPMVDMESSHVAAIAAELDIPLMVIRAVSDTAEDEMPAFLAKGYDQQKGKKTPWLMTKHLITHPGDFKKLKALLNSWQPVRNKLTEAVVKELSGG